MEELLKSLIDIQFRLDVPKNQVNNFGHYNYRSLEDIQAALKPLLREHNCGIRFEDTVVEHCGRTFLQTTLFFFNTKGESICTTAEAEHPATKTGMDQSQITGAASSYARKYALNALFAIDDSKDADTDAYTQATTQTKAAPKAPTSNKKDRYAGIRKALENTNSIDGLVALYQSHKNQVDSDDMVKQLFSQRKAELSLNFA